MAKPTFLQARANIEEALGRHGWALVRGLKIPHATSPNGRLRFWFKPQAVYYTTVSGSYVDRHQYANARTLEYNLDIREQDPEKFAIWADGQSEKKGD
jgi:hypothetical protein